MNRCLATLALLLLASRAAPAQTPEDPPAAPEVLGAPAAFGGEETDQARAEVPAGTPLRESPDARSAALAVVDVAIELPVLERRGEWLRVRYGGLVGWVSPEGAVPRGLGDLAPDRPPPAAYRPSRAPHPEARAALEARLGPPAAGHPRLGPWTLYTDLDDPALLAVLDRVVTGLPDLYRERYGLDPGLPEDEAVVLFAEEASYRAFAEEHAGLFAIGEGGHAGRGVAALYVGGRDRGELASLLVHELVHLLNARALGPRTPPWLEEGLANDLAFSELGSGGRLRPGTVGGAERRETSLDGAGRLVVRTTWDGGKGAMVSLGRSLRSGELLSVEALVRLPWHELVEPTGRSLRYAQSAFLVRYLLEQEAAAFRRYLRYLAAGGADDPAVLAEALGRGWPEVEAGFLRWLRTLAQALGLLEGR